MKMNNATRRPKPMNSPMILAELQGRLDPPHCSASKRQQTAEISIDAPDKSIYFILVVIGSIRFVLSSPLSLRKKTTATNTGTPMGRLLVRSSA